jgi:2-polyprenyl-3-methyl-5-hydroxy-6-metoxy-1,4-benzoquinol methylase
LRVKSTLRRFFGYLLPMAAARPQRETNPSVLRLALSRRVNQRIVGEGHIDLPCIPTMLDAYTTKLATLWEVLGKPFVDSEIATMRGLLEQQLRAGYQASPYARLIVSYQSKPPPEGIKYVIRLNPQTMDQIYSTGWVSEEKPLPFGRLPDAKVIALAKELGDAGSAPVLDVGAGTGRNAVPLARLGYPVRAIEPVAKLASEMRAVAEKEGLNLTVDEVDFFGPTVSLESGHYKLAIATEVLSHFRSVDQIRQFFEKLAAAMAPGGLILVSCFLSAEGYKPDAVAREATSFAWCSIFTRAELKFIVDELPFDRMSDESVHDYEKEHLPETGWPPTSWFATWTQGADAFDLPPGKAPMDMRWLVYRRRSST